MQNKCEYLIRGKNGERQCMSNKTRGNYCYVHFVLISALSEYNMYSCAHQYKSGIKKGYYCPLQRTHGQFCKLHSKNIYKMHKMHKTKNEIKTLQNNKNVQNLESIIQNMKSLKIKKQNIEKTIDLDQLANTFKNVDIE